MFGQFSTCDLVEFQRLLWSGQQQQTQYVNNQQPTTIITGIQQQPGTVITSNANSVLVQGNSMPVQRQQNFLNQAAVSFTTQPTTRYIPNQPQSRVINHSSPQNTILIQQQQPNTQTLFSQSQAAPLDLGKAAQEARIREMVPEFEEQYFIQTSPTKVSTSGRGNQGAQVYRPQPHVPTSQAISDHLSRSYPQQDLIQMHRQKIMQESKKKSRNEIYESAMVEMEIDDHAEDDDYEEEEEDDSEEEYEEYEPAGDEGPWKCGVCHKVYKRKANFLVHQKTHKNSEIQCSMCEQIFLTSKTYQKHLKSHHHSQQNTPQPQQASSSSNKRNSKKSQKQQQLQAAISSISGAGNGRQYQGQQYYQPPMMMLCKCDFCPEQFSSAEQLKAHEQQHLAESTLRCTHCYQPFLREEEFNQHLKTHLMETVWKCELCNTKYDEYKIYKDHLNTHLPIVYKDPPPKPPEPEIPEGSEGATATDANNGLDDDILEMEVIEDEASNSPKPSTSAAARSSPMKSFVINKAKYVTGSNMKVTVKGSSAKDIIVKPKSTPTSSAGVKTFDDDDDDIVVLSAPATPHRPIPLRVPPLMKKMQNKSLPPMKMKSSQQRPSAPTPTRRAPPPPPPQNKPKAKAVKQKSSPPARQQRVKTPRLIIETLPFDDEDDSFLPIQFMCTICKIYFDTKTERQSHILRQHCSQKSIEIKLLKLEDDPELDLEVISEDDEDLRDV